MLLRFMLIFLLPLSSHGASLTANLMTNMSKAKIIRPYSKHVNGILSTPLCVTCQLSQLIINNKTKLIVKGRDIPLEELTLVSIKEKRETIQIQYYKKSMIINYIIWGESEVQKSEPK